MLNTHKLLYVLPDVAYVAELLPTKKEHTFSIQSFRQINGEFMDDTEFLAQNVLKLFSKLEADEYHLILPDFLFTNTIVSVSEKSDAKIKEYLTSKLLPTLDLTTETHSIETFVLTEFKGNSKVQISAVERSVLAPIRVAAANHNLKITAVSPLSWTLKSVISLEPSISVIQIGSRLYSALHLLGVDQTTMTEVGETDVIAETIKTLKGGEPNIQTVYVLSNELVETKLKEKLANTVPLQQLSTFKDDDSQMPSYVREIIESGMKTLSISEFPVPKFELEKPTEADADIVAESAPAGKDSDDEDIEEVSATTASEQGLEKIEALPAGDEPEMLPTPSLPPVLAATAMIAPSETPDASVEAISAESESDEKQKEFPSISTESEGLPMPTANSDVTEVKSEEAVPEIAVEPTLPEKKEESELQATLSNFAARTATVTEPNASTISSSTETPTSPPTTEPTTAAPEQSAPTVLKNNSGVSTMLKMVFITLAVFFATVAVGVGVGLGLLQFSNKDTNTGTPEATPVAVASPEPTTDPTPSASPSAAVDAASLKVLVVNATTKAGYASTIKTALEKVEFTGIAAGNAKGEYADGNYLLVATESAALKSLVEEATDLTFTINSDKADKTVEDARNVYDVVVVLAE